MRRSGCLASEQSIPAILQRALQIDRLRTLGLRDVQDARGPRGTQSNRQRRSLVFSRIGMPRAAHHRHAMRPARPCLLEILPPQSAQCVHWYAAVLSQSCKTFPAHRDNRRVRIGPTNWPEDREVHPELFRAPQLRFVMTGRAAPRKCGTSLCDHELNGRQMYAISADSGRKLFAAADHDPATRTMGPLHHLSRKSRSGRLVQVSFANLHQTQAPCQCNIEFCQRRRYADFMCVADRIFGGERQGFENRRVRRKHWRNGKEIRPLPGDRLSFLWT